MKNSIIYFGLALAMFATNLKAETSLAKGLSTNLNFAAAVRANQFEKDLAGNPNLRKVKFAPEEDNNFLNPETVIGARDERPMEEIIAENQKITESKIVNTCDLFFMDKPIEDVIAQDNQIIGATISRENSLLFIEKNIEDVISADNAIIDAQVSTEVQPIDFVQIERELIRSKTRHKSNFGFY